MRAASLPELELAAAQARRLVLRMLESSHAGHLGGALSAIDIVTALYFGELNIDPTRPGDPNRDRFLLSAGHKCLAQYAVLALRGFFPLEVLDTYGTLNSRIPGHPDMHRLPGVEANTGSLGHGTPIACGMALGARISGSAARVFVVLGDGELPEGSNWEGASIAAHHGLDNLTIFVDANDLQISGRTRDVMNMASIVEKFRAFGWATQEIDGNDMQQITSALQQLPLQEGRPTAIIAHTVKAKGLSQMEDTASSHYWKPSNSDLEPAILEFDRRVAQLELRVGR